MRFIAMRCMPHPLAARMLSAAIMRNAWTFAGTSRFSWTMGRPLTLTFEDCPLCRADHTAEPCCSYYAATFERLFRELINADTAVRETACMATGAPACRFEIRC